ncbi:MAG: hypothetical protein QOC77_2337 [Thermoleophilaceae bacterium]|jgi:hypothetical protein|nr:hypothetical protein [Thermoleophilaceae bacterium]
MAAAAAGSAVALGALRAPVPPWAPAAGSAAAPEGSFVPEGSSAGEEDVALAAL